jgi:D-alanyl-D-alanine carboxypeptidase/D-alanyl-D-alanine-endopeptidase (penicillin-binding protein 4)
VGTAAACAVLAAGAGLVVVLGPRGAGAPTTRPSPSFAPVPSPPQVLAAVAAAPAPTGLGLRTALEPVLRSALLGGSVHGVVVDGSAGGVLYNLGGDAAVPPASTAKLVTAVAALTALGPDARFGTSMWAGRAANEVVLAAGGDPTLGAPNGASLDALAGQTAQALATRHVHRVRLVVDVSRFSGPGLAPGWRPAYLLDGDVVAVDALEVDEGGIRPDAPARYQRPLPLAIKAVEAALTRHGVSIGGPVAISTRPVAVTGPPIAVVRSRPAGQLVAQMLTNSDNDVAEALARAVAIHYRLPATFAGAAVGLRRALAAAGVDTTGIRLVDASGLSVLDRAEPAALAGLLLAAVRRPELRPVLTGLPVAGFTGTLAGRYRHGRATVAAGLVRAKTGTLSGVSALAGIVVDADGRLLVFAFVADHAPVSEAAALALDDIAAALASCGCR